MALIGGVAAAFLDSIPCWVVGFILLVVSALVASEHLKPLPDNGLDPDIAAAVAYRERRVFYLLGNLMFIVEVAVLGIIFYTLGTMAMASLGG
jgi:hypothetical protein